MKMINKDTTNPVNITTKLFFDPAAREDSLLRFSLLVEVWFGPRLMNHNTKAFHGAEEALEWADAERDRLLDGILTGLENA